jgi:tetratricopeptide (TPR) repeat protein
MWIHWCIGVPYINNKVGVNRGIPTRWLVQGLAKLKLGGFPLDRSIESVNGSPEAADEYAISGFNQDIDPGSDLLASKRAAIQAFSRAIQIDPKYASAYFMWVNVYAQIQEFPQVLADLDRAIALAPSSKAHNNRAIMNDSQGALADYDRAIVLNPKNFVAHINRGNLKADKLNNIKGVLADYNQAIAIDVSPRNVPAIIKDLRIAAKLYRQQGKTKELNILLRTIRRILCYCKLSNNRI